MLVTLIAAVGRDGCIGVEGRLPWRLPSDMKRFKQLTLGKPVIMGRKTWDSLPRKPLMDRANIVISRSLQADGIQAAGGILARSMEEALARAQETGASEVSVIGGGEIYALAMPHAARLMLTVVEADVPGGDAFFPEVVLQEWEVCETAPCPDAVPQSTYVTLART
jgi:dihydrofolate reductase